jgi:hypothetical protein
MKPGAAHAARAGPAMSTTINESIEMRVMAMALHQ